MTELIIYGLMGLLLFSGWLVVRRLRNGPTHGHRGGGTGLHTVRCRWYLHEWDEEGFETEMCVSSENLRMLFEMRDQSEKNK